ncbi:MAG: hypothetical protein GY755_21930 [Chloroflexi bacterium]|nr:hypothetical protein [Chloroflexota bacterium]
MKHKYLRITILVLIAGLALTSCRSKETKLSYPIGSVWNVSVEEDKVDWEAASALAQEQYAGFSLANEEAAFDVYTFGEGDKKDDVQAAVRSMVEGQAQNKIDPVAAILGATSNEATTRAAALANFFHVPMLVPSVSGDNLLSETNLWAFQLSAPNSNYADYILGTVLNKQIVYKGYDEGLEPEFRIAILYEQDTYGETAAVSAATYALEESYSIVLYDKFPAKNPSVSRLRALVNLALDEDAQMVIMIASDPDVALSLSKTFTDISDAQVRPLLVGMAAGFTSQEFMDSDLLEDTYILRQEIDGENCPAEIKSLYAAQNYAAVNLLATAIEDAANTTSTDEKKLSINAASDKIVIYRESLRDALKLADLELPCLGRVAFDNAGQNKFLRFEIITTEKGIMETISPSEFVELIRKKIDPTNIE